MVFNAAPIAARSACFVRASSFRKKALIFDHIFSIGLKSGLYGGRNHTSAPAARIAWATGPLLCGAKLSITTMSPGRRHGTRTCSTYAWKTAASVDPSITIAAAVPSRRIDESIVVVHQRPCGVASTTRWPSKDRPYSLVMLVLAPLSSSKTNRVRSMPLVRLRHAFRAAWTSGRFCSLAWIDFF